MDSSVWIQLIVTIGSLIGGMLITVRYSISQSNKKEKFFLEYLDKQEQRQVEYYEVKNGHLERISKLFSKAIDKNTDAINKLAKNK